MTFRLAIRALIERPVRSAVLAVGFGVGIGVMASLLGIGEVILQQAISPDLRGGGDVVVSGASGSIDNARFALLSVFDSPPLAGRVEAVSPSRKQTLYLIAGERTLPLDVRGGIPSLERRLDDAETGGIDAWQDTGADAAWVLPDPGDVLRAMDRFHPIPDVPRFAESWAEWLYFNGRAADTRFYLTFLAGPATGNGRRRSGVRLQLETAAGVETYSASAEIDEAGLLAGSPDVEIGRNRVRLDGLLYTIDLDLGTDQGEGRVTGRLVLAAVPGRSLPPIVLRGAQGWLSGYTVPVLDGPLSGELVVDGRTLALEGRGYHDHNWGFWEDVSWQWGQVGYGDLSFVYGRVLPPADVADPERMPGFLAALGPDGPIGFSTDVTIGETDRPGQAPRSIEVRARGVSLDLAMDLTVEDALETRMDRGPFVTTRTERDFYQLRATYRVSGQVGERTVEFEAEGAAETFRSR